MVPDNDGGILAEYVHQPDPVTDEVQKRVLLDRLRMFGLAKSAHVGSNDLVAAVGQRERQPTIAR